MNKFKVGDRVRCIESSSEAQGNVRAGQVYTVTGLNGETDVWVSGSPKSWSTRRFELANDGGWRHRDALELELARLERDEARDERDALRSLATAADLVRRALGVV